ncbi:hypothetical protein HanIR_Chr13g0621951 [Helianthus annuus]|nr:hypothetical protein HanIR_Chr13g0621951 [Helianthus annuus]
MVLAHFVVQAKPNAKRSLGVSGSCSRQQDALKSILVVVLCVVNVTPLILLLGSSKIIIMPI